MKNLTDNNKIVLRFIINFQKQNGYSPSILEIREATTIKSIRGISLQLDKLQKLGFIHREPQSRRAIKVLTKIDNEDGQKNISVPVVGEIAAGALSFAEENIEEYKKLPISMTHGRKDAFLLKVKGESMLKAGYRSGNLVIVIPQPTPVSGDIVVAYDPDSDGATLKRYKKLKDFVALLPESDDPKYKPIIGRQFAIQGKVIGKLDYNYEKV